MLHINTFFCLVNTFAAEFDAEKIRFCQGRLKIGLRGKGRERGRKWGKGKLGGEDFC
jgi:hypothetical protein